MKTYTGLVREEKAEMLVRDEDARQLQTAAEKTGIAKKLKKSRPQLVCAEARLERLF